MYAQTAHLLALSAAAVLVPALVPAVVDCAVAPTGERRSHVLFWAVTAAFATVWVEVVVLFACAIAMLYGGEGRLPTGSDACWATFGTFSTLVMLLYPAAFLSVRASLDARAGGLLSETRRRFADAERLGMNWLVMFACMVTVFGPLGFM